MNEIAPVTRIFEVIKHYAKVYNQLEALQRTSPDWLPIGDQKTGVIGKFYAKIYLESIHPNSQITFGSTSQQGWDIQVDNRMKIGRVQVKTVSEHSLTQRMSPIHPGWDQLFLVYLNKELFPIGFWVITDNTIVPAGGILKSRVMPRPGNPNSGSAEFASREDRLSELLNAILTQSTTPQAV